MPDVPQFTNEQLNEEFNRTLTANDPFVPKKIARFHFKDGVYRDEVGIDNTAVHFQMDGTVALIGSDEARPEEHQISSMTDTTVSTDDEPPAAAEAAGQAPAATAAAGDNIPRKNQFNYNERLSQTYVNPMRDHEIATSATESKNFSGCASQNEIFDSFLETYLSKGKDNASSHQTNQQSAPVSFATLLKNPKFAKCLNRVERIVNQNSSEKAFHAIKYFDDSRDFEKEDGSGSLLPLFTFSSELSAGKSVTALCWNPTFPDLFAVGYGSFDFLKASNGLVCCYSLKKPSHPLYHFETDSGVLCLDFHPKFSSLLAVGCYDGSVSVYDLRNSKRPIYKSEKKQSHVEPVWQIKFQAQSPTGKTTFCSVSSDGKVMTWIMNKNELTGELLMEIKMVESQANPEEVKKDVVLGLSAACTFDFHPSNDLLFVVGTEEGKLHKCSKAFSTQYLQSYEGHSMPVYSVQWNKFHPRVFLSCSSDWSIKIWDSNVAKATITLDVGTSIGDACWAPYSSSILAACTSDGRVKIYDIGINKNAPIGEYIMAETTPTSPGLHYFQHENVQYVKCTKLAFGSNLPVLLVGDERGTVTLFKLSPNLRKNQSNTSGIEKNKEIDGKKEEEKLEKILVHASKIEKSE